MTAGLSQTSGVSQRDCWGQNPCVLALTTRPHELSTVYAGKVQRETPFLVPAWRVSSYPANMLALCGPGWARALGDAGGFLPTHMVSRFRGNERRPRGTEMGDV